MTLSLSLIHIWMEKIIDRLYENGISTILATPTGARPRWMAQKYPEVLRVDASRHRNMYGERHNHCYTFLLYTSNYGIPFDNGAVIECLRTDMLEEAGYTVDDFTDITWSDFMEKAKVVKEKTGQPILTSQAGSPDLVMEMLQSCGESLFLSLIHI